MMHLYEISAQYKNVFNEVDETGEITENMLASLTEIGDAMEKKSIAVASFIKNLQAERDAVNKAKMDIAHRENFLNKKVERLEDYLRVNMEACGMTEICSSPYFTIKLKKCPVSVDVFDENQIPDEYKKRKEVITVDKVKIKEEIALGVIVPGASLKQNTRLEIR